MGFGPILISGGTIYLEDQNGKEHEFHYGASGIGLGAMKKLPFVPEIHIPKAPSIRQDPSVTGAAPTFAGSGAIFMTPAFHGEELRHSDFVGGTACFDAGAGIVADGGSATVMLP
jgi:hypothetical protein